MYRCEDFPCCGHYDEGGPERGIPYCPRPTDTDEEMCPRCGFINDCDCDVDVYPPEDDDFDYPASDDDW